MCGEFWTNISLIQRLYNQFLESVCTSHRITRVELDVLLFLANHPWVDTATGIVEQRRLAKSHVSSAVAGLEKRGCLERSYQNGNRRTVHLRLLPAADPLVADGRAAQRAFFDAVFYGFSREEIEGMENQFSRITENVRRKFGEE